MQMYEAVTLGLVAGATILLIVLLIYSRKMPEELEKKELILRSSSYNKDVDVLYCSIDGSSLDYCYRIEDTPSGIMIQYNEYNNITGIEIADFSRFTENMNSFPIIIDVDSVDPFTLKIMSINE